MQSWALVIPCWCEGSSLTHARSSCFRCSVASWYYTTTRLYGCTHNLLLMSAMDSLDWGLNNQMIYLPLASGTTWDSDGSLIGSGRFSTWFWLLLFYCVSVALWVDCLQLIFVASLFYDCVLYIPHYISSSALHGVMAFRQGVSEGMGSAPPSLQLRSFTSLFPLAGLYLASGNAGGGFVQRYTITA